ncbi:MAG: transcriptional repressor LexA [Candidatus Pacebacteria bacterium]|nr:transcriptional repressor LexA [Candidatus Paceibacterota bacterium]MDD3729341.1 transcriptional repressor LexA [Candidatus Paceibacterota bacterium]MDD4201516.1 transcriptional repressor LexA [Candidatus Paceibacterota bacterium]MDD5446106.1 transcriptional repressor LexA [Candidatus Paceibacterota bacterium]
MITKKQKQVLDFISLYHKKKGYSPSLEEIKKHFRHSSVSTAHFYIKKLQSLGFIGRQDNKPRSINIYGDEKMVNVTLLGSISAGKPIEAIENKESIAVPKSKLSSDGKFYALRVIGNSMIDENINDGDIVLVKQQSIAEDGQKVVALIDNYEATLKKFYKERGFIRLQPANKDIEPIIIKKDRELTIQGIVIDVIKNEEELQATKLSSQKEIKKLKLLPLNKIICGDAVLELKKFPDKTIDLVVTSPPYDEIRKYNGFNFDLHATGKEIFRVLKDGGIAIMVIQDQTKDFGKSLTSFRTIVDWVDNIGFKLFETVIYRKYGAEGAWWNKRFRVDHEYMPIFLKGKRPQYFNKEPLKIPSKHGGKTMTGGGTRLTNGIRIATRAITINPTKCRGTIWEYMTAGDGTRLKHQHPATFPDRLPYDFIQCFCPQNGVVLDPFIGSGTTALSAIELERNYIGIDISRDYCELAKKRIKEEGINNKRLF